MATIKHYTPRVVENPLAECEPSSRGDHACSGIAYCEYGMCDADFTLLAFCAASANLRSSTGTTTWTEVRCVSFNGHMATLRRLCGLLLATCCVLLLRYYPQHCTTMDAVEHAEIDNKWAESIFALSASSSDNSLACRHYGHDYHPSASRTFARCGSGR